MTANRGTPNVSVLLNDGAGGFFGSQYFFVGGLADTLNSVAVADMNNDHVPDVVAAAFDYPTSFISVLPGDGAGGFGPPITSPSARFGVESLAVGDLDANGNVDVVSAHSDGTITVLYGDGTGRLPRTMQIPAALYPGVIVLADLNGDRTLDLAVPDFEAGTVLVLLNVGLGLFAVPTSLPVGAYNPAAVAVADMTGEGAPDLVTANMSDSLSVLVGNGRGRFAAARLPIAVPQGLDHLATGDLNGDGRLDVVTASGSRITVLLSRSSF